MLLKITKPTYLFVVVDKADLLVTSLEGGHRTHIEIDVVDPISFVVVAGQNNGPY